MISESADRVPRHTAASVNRAIRQRTERSVAYFSEHPEEIPQRLEQLDAEWDVERALATGSSCLSLLGIGLGLSGRPRWFFLPLGVQGFYLQHTLQGWCPPLPIFRRLGFRTPAEIEEERCALQAFLEGEANEAHGRNESTSDYAAKEGRFTAS
jgi:hypothetical protein